MLKRIARSTVRHLRAWLAEPEEEDEHSLYPTLNALHERISAESSACSRPYFTWCLLHSAHLARMVGADRISAVEFGVAGGSGLVALEATADRVSETLGVKIEVHGFDSGKGLPPVRDPRDLPNLWHEGAYPMDEQLLRSRLRRATLHIGWLEETVPSFIDAAPAPIGFMSVDVDLYSSATQALQVLRAQADLLLPRVHCYFDDILGHTYADHNGERLAIREFNDIDPQRKLSPIFGLRHFVPRSQFWSMWPEQVFLAHILDHPQYGANDGLMGVTRLDLVE